MTETGTDLADWLGRYGLDQYAQTFAENNIEYSVLPDLTENDLKKLGVTLGHRKKLLRAIEALTAGRRAHRDNNRACERPRRCRLLVGQQREAELRQITVMFCDLVGSTPLSEKLDPEDLRVLIDAYREACGTAIKRYGGEVASYARRWRDGIFRLATRPRG